MGRPPIRPSWKTLPSAHMNNKLTRQPSSGFSLFEVIVYLAIVSVLMVTVLAIAAESLATRTKALAMHNVTYEAQFVLDRLTADIRAAADINAADLASHVITLTLANGETHRYEVSNHQIVLRINNGAAQPITSRAVAVSEFVVVDRTAVGDTPNALGLTLTLTAVSTNPRPEFQAEQTLTTTVSTRL